MLFYFSQENRQSFTSGNPDSGWVVIIDTATATGHQFTKHIFVFNGNNFGEPGQAIQGLAFQNKKLDIILLNVELLY